MNVGFDTLFPLRDGIGSLTLLDFMGDDITVVDAARVSFNKESAWLPAECPAENRGPDGHCRCDATCVMNPGTLEARDQKLISFLARNSHWTPFAQCQLQIRVKAPIFVARQWFKHQIGTTRNEVSRRYVTDRPECYIPNEWRMRAPNVKQGSSDQVLRGVGEAQASAYLNRAIGAALAAYQHLLEAGVCPEQARMALPQSMYTEWVETMSLATAARIFRQRTDLHAQWEIRKYAEALGQVVPPEMLNSWNALVEEGTS